MAGLSGNEGKAMVTIYKSLNRESDNEGEELFSVVHRSNETCRRKLQVVYQGNIIF